MLRLGDGILHYSYEKTANSGVCGRSRDVETTAKKLMERSAYGSSHLCGGSRNLGVLIQRPKTNALISIGSVTVYQPPSTKVVEVKCGVENNL